MKGQFSQTLRLLQSPSLQLRRIALRPKTRPIPVQRAPVFQQVTFRRYAHNEPVDDPAWSSVIDQPPLLVRSAQKHSPGIIILLLIPVIAFGLGTWQIYRLGRKTELITRFEDRILRPPLPLPPRIDPDAIKDFDYRRIYTTGTYRHDQEMLIGPRIHDGTNGYLVVTPLERGSDGSKVLVNRGWIPKGLARQADRPAGVPQGPVTVEGLLREPWTKNYFTPDNIPELGQFVFPDVGQMAKFTGSEPIWIEETMRADLIQAYDREAKGIPIGRPAEVNLRNNHTQYIVTWYALSLATAIMFWMVVKKQPSEVSRRIRASNQW